MKVQSHQEVPMGHQDPRVTRALNKYCSTLAEDLIHTKAVAPLEARAFPGAGPGALPLPSQERTVGETWSLGIPHRLFFLESGWLCLEKRTLDKYPENTCHFRKYTKFVGN